MSNSNQITADREAVTLDEQGLPMDTATTPEVAQDEGVRFDDLGLPEALCRALADAGYTSPTPVQSLAIPAALGGADLKVASQTGSGKTAAFMLPALAQVLAARGENTKRREKGIVHGPRVLVLAPTRELAMQVAKAATTYGRHVQGLRVATIVGGVPYGAQLKALKGPLDVLIATPGRLLDHLGTGAAVLNNLEVLVLDEADRMLDMGFIEDIEAIAAQTPAERKTWMFSATFAGHVGQLAHRLTRDPQDISVASHTDSHDNIEQRLHVADSLHHKNDLLDHVLTSREVDQAVVFTSTQRDADVLADRLAEMGHAVAALHGGMPQGRRNRVLQALRMRQLRVLVATDVAARGIDVPTITHVINYGMPMKAEDYVHRIGRTGRAGRSGLAVTLAERRDIPMVRRIERFTTQRIPEAVIAGLEPKTKLAPEKTGGRFGKPMPGQRHRDDRGPRFGGPRGQGENRFDDRRRDGRGEAPFRDRAAEPRFDNRGDHRGDNRFDSRSDNRFEQRGEQRFDPRFEQRADAGRGFQDRGQDKPFGKPYDKKPFGKPFGDRQPQGERTFGERKAFGENKSFGENKPFGEKKAFGEKFGDKKPFGDRKPFGGKPGFKQGGKPSFGGPKRAGFGKREG